MKDNLGILFLLDKKRIKQIFKEIKRIILIFLFDFFLINFSLRLDIICFKQLDKECSKNKTKTYKRKKRHNSNF